VNARVFVFFEGEVLINGFKSELRDLENTLEVIRARRSFAVHGE
jgi:hypothetical protein